METGLFLRRDIQEALWRFWERSYPSLSPPEIEDSQDSNLQRANQEKNLCIKFELLGRCGLPSPISVPEPITSYAVCG